MAPLLMAVAQLLAGVDLLHAAGRGFADEHDVDAFIAAGCR